MNDIHVPVSGPHTPSHGMAVEQHRELSVEDQPVLDLVLLSLNTRDLFASRYISKAFRTAADRILGPRLARLPEQPTQAALKAPGSVRHEVGIKLQGLPAGLLNKARRKGAIDWLLLGTLRDWGLPVDFNGRNGQPRSVGFAYSPTRHQ